MTVLALVGPTASGKSSLAVAIALRLITAGRACEIVNGDSMLVYRGMDVGTAKPTVAERAGVPHHMIDVLDVRETASVAWFRDGARTAIADCQARGARPILVGGSALYTHAILDRMDFPPTDAAVRARWEQELQRVGPQALHGVLAERNRAAAAAILPGNGRRIVRALEVTELTGDFNATLPDPEYAIPARQIGLTVPVAELDRRIADRVDAMWRAGFVDEVRTLATAGLRDGLTAARALGYRQVLAYLDGELSEADAKQATIVATRRFARKQAAWWRRDHRIEWLPFDDPDLAEKIAAEILGRGVDVG